jgi:hypothetical protein
MKAQTPSQIGLTKAQGSPRWRVVRRFDSCGGHGSIIEQIYPTERNEMELINLDVSEYGISLTSYFGDMFFFWRTIVLLAGIVVALRLRKLYKNRKK